MTIPEDTPNPPARQALLDLAERCEREEPSRLLDSLIAVALRIRPAGKLNAWLDEFPTWRPRGEGRVEVVHTGDKVGGVHWEAASYTDNLDAAATLLPEGLRWGVGGNPVCGAVGPHIRTTAGTPALALCAAALRARAGEA